MFSKKKETKHFKIIKRRVVKEKTKNIENFILIQKKLWKTS